MKNIFKKLLIGMLVISAITSNMIITFAADYDDPPHIVTPIIIIK
jgi:hypothetical protein